jgi:FkbM family methyltransferase
VNSWRKKEKKEFMMENNFIKSFCEVLCNSLGVQQHQNYDDTRFGKKRTESFDKKLFTILVFFLSKLGLTTINYAKSDVRNGLNFVSQSLDSLEWLYAHLVDQESRKTLVDVVAYRALGHRKIKLAMNTLEHWAVREKAFNLPREAEEIDVGFLGWKLQKVSLETFGYPITIFANKSANVTTFVHQQYRCETAGGGIGCLEGDYVIDAGGCYGDTALYFSHLAGPAGRVASFEFLPQNLSVFRKNLQLNPTLAKTIQVYENPVWAESGNELFVSGSGPGTRVTENKITHDATSVSTLKIDDVVGRADFPKVDFIKMDIEGAEQQALIGAEACIRRFKPKLAITVYHSLEDFWEIPRWIDGLGLGYKFYLRHFTIHSEETVLFAH